MYGSIKDGELGGTWKPAFTTVAAVLFWPEAMTFFYTEVKRLDPEFLSAYIRCLNSVD
jgi:hypothetical protein